MKVHTRGIQISFQPIEVTIILESREEMLAIKRALETYRTSGTYGGYLKVVEQLIPAFTPL